VLIAFFYASYIILRCLMNKTLAPAYDVAHHTLSEKLKGFVKYVLPLGIVFFLVLGVIFLGIATPTEAAATGALGSLLLAAAYGKLSFQVLIKSLSGTLHVTVMAFMIIAASKTYSSILAYTGASRELVQFVMDLQLPGIVSLIGMMLILMVLGTFMEQVSMMMIAIPMFMPIIHSLGFDPIWFAILMLLNLEMAMSTPPFGMLLFVMKGSAPPGTTLGDVCKAAIPFLTCDLIVMILLILFPSIVLFLPRFM
jgi:tripartite ATP-independent transporter DctM subunit